MTAAGGHTGPGHRHTPRVDETHARPDGVTGATTRVTGR